MSDFSEWCFNIVILEQLDAVAVKSLLGTNSMWVAVDDRGVVFDQFFSYDNIEEAVDYWHDHYEGGYKLHEFLGMTWEQYCKYVEGVDCE